MTMTISRQFIFLVVIVVCSVSFFNKVNAQNSDVRLWLSSEFKKEITNKLKADVEIEYRQDQLLTTFDKVFIQPAVAYNLTDNIRIGGVYRLMFDQNKTREKTYKQRVAAYFRYSIDVDDFELKFKTALQYGFDDVTNASLSYDQKLVNRNAINVVYNWFGKKFKPFVGYELFYHVNDPNGGIINQSRLEAGTNYQLSDNIDLSVFYMYENEFNVAFPSDSHIIGCSFSYSF